MRGALQEEDAIYRVGRGAGEDESTAGETLGFGGAFEGDREEVGDGLGEVGGGGGGGECEAAWWWGAGEGGHCACGMVGKK